MMKIIAITGIAWSLLLCHVLTSPLPESPDCVSWHNELGNLPAPSSTSLPAPPLPSSSTSSVSSSPAVPSISAPSAGAADVLDSGTGHATYYSPEVGLGSCGVLMQPSDLIVAAPVSLMQPAANPNLSPHCYQQVRLTKQGGTQTVTVAIMDTCGDCQHGNWDVTKAGFAALNCTLEQGVCPLTWELLGTYAPRPGLEEGLRDSGFSGRSRFATSKVTR